MSIFAKWFSRPEKKSAFAPLGPQTMFAEPLGMSQHDMLAAQSPLVAAKPVAAAPQHDSAAPRPGERSARREMVYSAVCESMVRSGILSAGYKFKVLALDKRATQFIVMVDLAQQHCASPDKLTQIESLIAYSAKTRFEIVITSVYWRLNAQLGAASSKAPSIGTAGTAAPQATVLPVPLGMDPVDEAEIAAFKKALLEAAMNPVPALDGATASHRSATSTAPRPAPIVPPARSAAQQAEMAREAARRGGAPAPTADTSFGGLSNTQYGDLH
ncbi:hypothetical protein GCM10027276_08020 [Comamonas piscis]